MIDSSPSSTSSTYSAALAVGSTVAHYTIRAELGLDAFGIVYPTTEQHGIVVQLLFSDT